MKKTYLNALKIENKTAFKTRVFNAIENENASRKKRKVINRLLIGLPALAIPVAVFAATSFSFMSGGQSFNFSNQNSGPISQVANPTDPFQELGASGDKIYNLSESKAISNFSIRQPGPIKGWTRSVSEGIVGIQKNYYFDQKTNTRTLITVTDTPLKYVDIYTNNDGQRIAITQEYDSVGTQELQNKVAGKPNNGSGWILGKNATLLPGFQASTAFLISGNWKDNPAKVPYTGNFKNLLLLHQENNNTVTKIVIDEYGSVDSSTLESFAHSYLNAPIQ